MLNQLPPQQEWRVDTTDMYDQTFQEAGTLGTGEEARMQAELRMEIDVLDLDFPRWILLISQILLRD
jgi:hypothetical protein